MSCSFITSSSHFFDRVFFYPGNSSEQYLSLNG